MLGTWQAGDPRHTVDHREGLGGDLNFLERCLEDNSYTKILAFIELEHEVDTLFL